MGLSPDIWSEAQQSLLRLIVVVQLLRSAQLSQFSDNHPVGTTLSAAKVATTTLRLEPGNIANVKWLSLLQKPLCVISAEAGIQSFQGILDPRLRVGDAIFQFFKSLGLKGSAR
jgi:hypothetical protein